MSRQEPTAYPGNHHAWALFAPDSPRQTPLPHHRQPWRKQPAFRGGNRKGRHTPRPTGEQNRAAER